MSDMSSIRHLLESTRIIDTLHERQSVITLEHDMSVGQALQQLARYKILSAPVVLSPDLEDLEGGGDNNLSPQLLGWIDVADVLQALLTFLHEGDTPTSHRAMPMLKVGTPLHGLPLCIVLIFSF
jgi:CBS domain-containing protein